MEAFFEHFHERWKNASLGALFDYLTKVWKLFSNIFTRGGKTHHLVPNLITSKSKNLSIRLKILMYKSDMQSYIKSRVKFWELIQLKVRNQYLLSLLEI